MTLAIYDDFVLPGFEVEPLEDTVEVVHSASEVAIDKDRRVAWVHVHAQAAFVARVAGSERVARRVAELGEGRSRGQ
jgi:hypothetical protein